MREHPEVVYKNVKSKIARNFKSQAKAKKREKLKQEATANNESPIAGSLKFLFEQKLSSAKKASSSPIKSALGKNIAASLNNRISKI